MYENVYEFLDEFFDEKTCSMTRSADAFRALFLAPLAPPGSHTFLATLAPPGSLAPLSGVGMDPHMRILTCSLCQMAESK